MNDGQPPPMSIVDLDPATLGAGHPCSCPGWWCTVAPDGRLREFHHPDCGWPKLGPPADPLNLDAGRPVA